MGHGDDAQSIVGIRTIYQDDWPVSPSIAVDDSDNRHKRLYKTSTTLVGFHLLAFKYTWRSRHRFYNVNAPQTAAADTRNGCVGGSLNA
jgi:hypothetical protein